MNTGKTNTSPKDHEDNTASTSAQCEPEATSVAGEVSGPGSHEVGTAATVPEHSSREVDFARRALVQAGWVVPTILALGLPPRRAFGDEGAGPSFRDRPIIVPPAQ